MALLRIVLLVHFMLSIPAALVGQTVVSGRLRTVVTAGERATVPLGGVFVFACPIGEAQTAAACRTWETEPAGWYRLAVGGGDQTLLFAEPAQFLRPTLRRIACADDGAAQDCDVEIEADHTVLFEREWDRQPAVEYYQPFVARGTSVTQVGFKLAHDGVDGFGPGSQDLIVSIHRCVGDDPGQWPQLGPAMPVLGVDCGGGKNRSWSAGWDSGQVSVKPGETCAVRLRASTERGAFQAFWQPSDDTAACCLRRGAEGALAQSAHRLWLSVASDADGLLVPYNKRVHREYGQFGGFARKWSQTYVAQGKSLAGVVLYAACGGTQPPMTAQRVIMRVRHGGADGPVIGTAKVAAGAGNYTGDASWGVFGAACAPGETPLTPGDVYAVEFETLESPESLRGFVNIKGQVSDERPGFNPYRKQTEDDYAAGAAYRDGVATDFDLDLQIIEYAVHPNGPEGVLPRRP